MFRSSSFLRVASLSAFSSFCALSAVAGVAVTAGALVGCAQPQADTSGSAEVVVSASSALSLADIATVELTVSAPDMATPIVQSMAKTGTTWGGIVGHLPAGTGRTFKMTAYDVNHTAIYGGEADGVTIVANQTVHVSITLQELHPSAPYSNAAPVLTALAVSATTVLPGQAVTLAATATDPNGDAIHYQWTATDGSFASATSASTTWTAPTKEGSYTLTITVSDPAGAQSVLTVVIQVASASAFGSAAVNVAINNAPSVQSIGIGNNPIAIGQSVTLALAASDPDGDALTYAWTANCDGTFTSPTDQNPTFKPNSGSGACKLTVAVSDGKGGQTTGTLDVIIGAGATVTAPTAPPVVDSTFQSTANAAVGAAITLSLTSHDPDGTGVTVAWSTTGGTLSTPSAQTSGTSTTSGVQWTAPAAGGSFTVTATITDASGATTTQTFTVSGDASAPPVCVAPTIPAGECGCYCGHMTAAACGNFGWTWDGVNSVCIFPQATNDPAGICAQTQAKHAGDGSGSDNYNLGVTCSATAAPAPVLVSGTTTIGGATYGGAYGNSGFIGNEILTTKVAEIDTMTFNAKPLGGTCVADFFVLTSPNGTAWTVAWTQTGAPLNGGALTSSSIGLSVDGGTYLVLGYRPRCTNSAYFTYGINGLSTNAGFGTGVGYVNDMALTGTYAAGDTMSLAISTGAPIFWEQIQYRAAQ